MALDLNSMSREQLLAHIASLKAVANAKLTLKVGEKGTVCVYGMGRYPVSLYASQWERLLDQKDEILAFLKSGATNAKTGAPISQGKEEA